MSHNMRPTVLKQAIINAIAADIPIMITGSPGLGKSDIVRQAAEAAGYEHVEDLRLSQLDQVDLRGVPAVVYEKDSKGNDIPGTGQTTWNPPEFLCLPPKSVLFLDELNSAQSGVLAAAYQLVLNRRVGRLQLPADCRIVAAGNLSTDFAMVNQMPSALKNRMTHVTLECNNDDWCEWAASRSIHPSVIGFLRFRPNMLNEFDRGNRTTEAKSKARNLREATSFATPRSWEMLSKYLAIGVGPQIEYSTYTSIVGEAAAAEFTGFQKHYRSLPDLDELLRKPKTTKVPDEPATLYALSAALAAHTTPDNMDTVMQYMDRVTKEFQVMYIRDATLRNRDNAYTTVFNKWSAKNSELLV